MGSRAKNMKTMKLIVKWIIKFPRENWENLEEYIFILH